MKAKLEALELAEKRREAKLEAVQSDNNRLRGEVSGITHCLLYIRAAISSLKRCGQLATQFCSPRSRLPLFSCHLRLGGRDEKKHSNFSRGRLGRCR